METKTIELDGSFNVVADVLGLSAEEKGCLYLGSRYVDVVAGPMAVVFTVGDVVIGDHARVALGQIEARPLVPFVYRMIELAGLLEVC